MSSAIKVNFEIGHVASVRSKLTPEGFTHDWEVFLRGTEGAEISNIVEKVVFHLHNSFKKPRRVVKEPPYSVKESGYAGFTLPIDIYLKNKGEPKKIQFNYDFTLEEYGLLRDRYIFQNPNEEFRKKLLNSGGIPVSNDAYYVNPGQGVKKTVSLISEKQQLVVSKPKLSSNNIKNLKSKAHEDDLMSSEYLFGPPSHKNDKEKGKSISADKLRHENRKTKSDEIGLLKKRKDKGRSEKQIALFRIVSFLERSKEKQRARLNERPTPLEVCKEQRVMTNCGHLLEPPNQTFSTVSPNPKNNLHRRHENEEIKSDKINLKEDDNKIICDKKQETCEDKSNKRKRSNERPLSPDARKKQRLMTRFEYLFGPSSPNSNEENEMIFSSNKKKITEAKGKRRSEQERKISEGKSNKRVRPNERSASPDVCEKRHMTSPVARVPSNDSSIKYEPKLLKCYSETVDPKTSKVAEKLFDVKIVKEMKERKNCHVRDQKRNVKKEHIFESHKLKNSPKEFPKEITKASRDLPVNNVQNNIQYTVDNGPSNKLQESSIPCYTQPMRDLQERILKILKDKDDYDLIGDIIDLIVQTGCYEETTEKGLEFDLCLLDGPSLQRLIQLVGSWWW